MTETDWHAPVALLARFVTDPNGVDGTTAASIEAHLVTCAGCRQQAAAAADPALFSSSWDAIAERIDQPRVRLFERALRGIGIGSGLARLLAATPALQGAGVLAIAVVAASAALLSLSADADGPFLVLAPLVPLAAVASSFAPVADPAGEAGTATPVHGAGLVVRRAVAIVGVSFCVLGVAALAVGDLGPAAAAWVLPAFALTVGAMSLGTWLRIEVAVGALTGVWLLAVWSVWWLEGRDAPVIDSATFAASGQLTALAVAVAAALIVAARRDRFATLEAFR